MAYFASHIAFAACAALSVRRAALGSPILAGGDQISFDRGRGPSDDEADFHSGKCRSLAGRFMDVPLFIHGAHLLPSHHPGSFDLIWILAP